MDIDKSLIIDDFFSTRQDIFTVDDFIKFLKNNGVRLNKNQAFDLVNSSTKVFSLINQEYITRSGVFTGRWFSFKPTKEEVRKGQIIIGHRCMPFVNPEVSPDKINVMVGKNQLKSSTEVFSMNLAMDVFALFGEGYVIPYIFGDEANKKVQLASVQYGLPTEIELTSWSLAKIAGRKKFNYGDRILGRVVNWAENLVEFSVLKADENSSISAIDIEREEWYSIFEKGMLENFEKNGPTNSIEEQLAFLFLENQSELCVKSCGSIEEFLQHTKRIAFSLYGVESRIWRTGETIPYIGSWNKEASQDMLFSDMAMIFSPQIVDAYLEDYLWEKEKKPNDKTIEELVNGIFPTELKMSPNERKFVLLNIEKRHDIIKKNYDQFFDYKIAPVRHRVIALFSQVTTVLCSIGCSGLNLEEFPQQELVILTQLFAHIERIIEEMENVYLRDSFPIEDVEISLEGMEDTYDEIGGTLLHSLETLRYKNIKIVD